VIDLMKGVEHKFGEPAPTPEPRRLAAADQEVVQLFVARLRRQILQEIEEARRQNRSESPPRRLLNRPSIVESPMIALISAGYGKTRVCIASA